MRGGPKQLEAPEGILRLGSGSEIDSLTRMTLLDKRLQPVQLAAADLNLASATHRTEE